MVDLTVVAAEPEPYLECLIPVRTVSEANLREHWSARARRRRRQREAVWLWLRQIEGVDGRWASARQWPSWSIELVRVEPRRLDTDNLAVALKGVRDEVARWLGVDDGDARVRWSYAQRPPAPGERRGVQLRLERGASDSP